MALPYWYTVRYNSAKWRFGLALCFDDAKCSRPYDPSEPLLCTRVFIGTIALSSVALFSFVIGVIVGGVGLRRRTTRDESRGDGAGHTLLRVSGALFNVGALAAFATVTGFGWFSKLAPPAGSGCADRDACLQGADCALGLSWYLVLAAACLAVLPALFACVVTFNIAATPVHRRRPPPVDVGEEEDMPPLAS